MKEVKRVPLTFDYPLNIVWSGFVNPYPGSDCDHCDATGLNPQTRFLNNTFGQWEHDLTQCEVDLLVEKGRLKEGSTAEGTNYSKYFHDGINRCYLVEARAKRLNVWGRCDACDGNGDVFNSKAERTLSEAWEPTEPPSGDGYQLWDEKCPLSPVFENAETLAVWCENNAYVFAFDRASSAEWLTMIKDDFICKREGNMLFC